MNLKAICTSILIFGSILLVSGQSKEILARSAMLNAEESYNNGNYSECQNYLKDAEANLGKTNSAIQYLKVKSWMGMGSKDQYNKDIWSQADIELKRFFEVTPENSYVPEKYDEMLLALIKIKKYIADADEGKREAQEAIDKWTAEIKEDPANADAYNRRAIGKNRLKDYQGAIQDYTKAIQINPNQINPNIKFYYNNRAWAKANLKDYQGAIQDYTKVIELDPNYSEAYYERGKILQLHIKDIQAAKRDFEKVILIGEDEIFLTFSNYFLGNKDKAFSLLFKMERDAGDNKEKRKSVYYNLACFFSLDNNRAEAINSLRKALELGYDNFLWIENDEDWDNIKNTPEFKELISKYKK